MSFILFGLFHTVNAASAGYALYRFFVTGVFGFAMAAVYLYSRNLIVPILIHFVYDIFANSAILVTRWAESGPSVTLDQYIFPAAALAMAGLAVWYLVREPVQEGCR